MYGLLAALAASFVVSLISLIGVFTLLFKEALLKRILIVLIAFSAGGLIGGAFLHLLPEALENAPGKSVFAYVLLGFFLFFVLERYLHWRHCHEGQCAVHTFTYMNLVGDGIHNFVDGLVIGASFTVGMQFGCITSLIIILHEIPQEMGDFGVLVYGGFTRSKALFFNFLSGITCIIGAAIGYLASVSSQSFLVNLLPITAGGFIYIAACDLIPELHKEPGLKRAMFSVLAFGVGIGFIWLARQLPDGR